MKRSFLKAAAAKTAEICNENAAKISGGIYAAQDLLFTTGGFFLLGLNFPPQKPEDYLPVVTGLYFAEGVALLGADKIPALKKPAGFFGVAGSLTMLVAGTEPDAALLLGTGVPPLITGLAMMFEDKVHAVAHKVSNWPGIVGGAAGVFAKFPTATTAMIQNIAPAFLMAYAGQSDNPYIGAYAGAWGVANCFLALTDDNLKQLVRDKFYGEKQDMVANDMTNYMKPLGVQFDYILKGAAANDDLVHASRDSVAIPSAPFNSKNDLVTQGRFMLQSKAHAAHDKIDYRYRRVEQNFQIA
jgi:hypothetical protein